MDLNVSLIGQMITFAIFVWFTMRFVWPLLSAQLDERKRRIADGLEQAEQGNKFLLSAEKEAQEKVQHAKLQSQKILQDANTEAHRIIDEAKQQARQERDDILAAGHNTLQFEVAKAKNELQQQMAQIIVLGAEKILERSIKPEDHQDLLDKLAKGL